MAGRRRILPSPAFLAALLALATKGTAEPQVIQFVLTKDDDASSSSQSSKAPVKVSLFYDTNAEVAVRRSLQTAGQYVSQDQVLEVMQSVCMHTEPGSVLSCDRALDRRVSGTGVSAAVQTPLGAPEDIWMKLIQKYIVEQPAGHRRQAAASALISSATQAAVDHSITACKLHGLPSDGVFCMSLLDAWRDHYRESGLKKIAAASLLHLTHRVVDEAGLDASRRMLQSASLVRMAWNAVYEEARLQHIGPQRVADTFARCADAQTSCSACDRCFRAIVAPLDLATTAEANLPRPAATPEQCRDNFLPTFQKLRPVDRWMYWIDGRDQHRGDMAYEDLSGLDKPAYFVSLHGHDLASHEIGAGAYSYLGSLLYAFEQTVQTCSMPLSAELVVQMWVWFMDEIRMSKCDPAKNPADKKNECGRDGGDFRYAGPLNQPTELNRFPVWQIFFRINPGNSLVRWHWVEDAEIFKKSVNGLKLDAYPTKVRKDFIDLGIDEACRTEFERSRNGSLSRDQQVKEYLWGGLVRVVNVYHQQLAAATSRDAVLEAIATLVYQLQNLHFFTGGNSRVAAMVLQRELVLQGFHPSILFNTQGTWTTVNTHFELVELIKEGMRAWKHVTDGYRGGADDDPHLPSPSPWTNETWINDHVRRFPNKVRDLRAPGQLDDDEIHPFYHIEGSTYADLADQYS